MKINEDVFLLKYYAKTIWKKLIVSILSSFGSLWFIVQITTFFLGDDSPLIYTIKENWYVFLFIGLLVVIVSTKPKFTFGSKITNRDILVEISIGNLFKKECSLVISSNTTFDTHISNELISEKSSQGQFTKLFYHGNESQLDRDITFELKDIQPEILGEDRIGKIKKYPIGTTVKLNQKNRNFYFIAIANINKHGVASATLDDLKQALACLWYFIGNRGLKENIAIPVIGSGFSRISQNREIIIKEIIRSFVAACSESTFCEKLTIVINPNDIEKYNIDTKELEKFIEYVCKYTDFSDNLDKAGHQM